MSDFRNYLNEQLKDKEFEAEYTDYFYGAINNKCFKEIEI